MTDRQTGDGRSYWSHQTRETDADGWRRVTSGPEVTAWCSNRGDEAGVTSHLALTFLPFTFFFSPHILTKYNIEEEKMKKKKRNKSRFDAFIITSL